MKAQLCFPWCSLLCWLLQPEFLLGPVQADSVAAIFNVVPKRLGRQVADLHTWLNKSALHCQETTCRSHMVGLAGACPPGGVFCKLKKEV